MIQHGDIPYHDMSLEERLLLVEDIWDSIVAEEQSVPVTDAQRLELRRRLAAHRAHPEGAVSWEDAKLQVRARLNELRSR